MVTQAWPATLIARRKATYLTTPTPQQVANAKAQQPSGEMVALVELAKPQAYFLAPGWLPVEFKSFER